MRAGAADPFAATGPLVMEARLRCAARVHSLDMANRGFFDHVNPDGEDPFVRMERAGYSFQAAGENIAAGHLAAGRAHLGAGTDHVDQHAIEGRDHSVDLVAARPAVDPDLARTRLGWLTRDLRRDYGRVVLDCPPVLNEVTEQIFAAADVVIVPLPPSPLGARALDQLRAEFARRDRRHPPVLPLVSMFDSRRKAHREARDGPMAGLPVIPAASPIEQMAFRRTPVGVFAPHTEASRALDRLWRGIESKLTDLAIPPVT